MMDARCDGVRFADDADVLRGGGVTVKSVVSLCTDVANKAAH